MNKLKFTSTFYGNVLNMFRHSNLSMNVCLSDFLGFALMNVVILVYLENFGLTITTMITRARTTMRERILLKVLSEELVLAGSVSFSKLKVCRS